MNVPIPSFSTTVPPHFSENLFLSTASSAQGRRDLLLEQIRKLNCDGCKLKTEHYLLSDGDNLLVCRCLKCGRIKGDIQFVTESMESYPADESRPVYVV